MKIGVLTTSFPRHATDGAGRFVLESAEFFAKRGHQLRVLFPEAPTGTQLNPHPNIALEPISYAWPRPLARTFYRGGAPYNLARDPLAWIGALTYPPALARAARRYEWDAIISHWSVPCGLAGALHPRVPRHLMVFHSGDVHLLRRLPMRRQIASILAERGTGFLFVSHRLRDQFTALVTPRLQRRVRQRSLVTPMGFTPVDLPSSRDRARSSLGLKPKSSKQFVALTMSRLVPIKGLDTVIQAVYDQPDTTLIIAGDGPERDALQSASRGARSQITLLGHVSGADKANRLAAADAFILCSRRLADGREEGLPTALLEAMHAGLPIVATRTGGIPELLEHGRDALLIEPDEPEALCAALARLRDDPALRAALGRRAHARASAFRWDQVGHEMARIGAIPVRAESAASPLGIGTRRSTTLHCG